MSAEKLRTAARVLRERAEAAPAEPWYEYRLDYPPSGDDPKWIVDSPARFICDTNGDHEGCEQVATYIATTHPGFGQDVADWLDTEAAFVARWPGHEQQTVGAPEAFRIADRILGGAS